MNSKKSPHESSLQVISRIETETFPVFHDLSISDLFYVERCLDEKIQSLAIDQATVNQPKLAKEVNQFKEKIKITEAVMESCRLFEKNLLVIHYFIHYQEYKHRIEINEQKLDDLEGQRKKLEIFNSVKQVMSKMVNIRLMMALILLTRRVVLGIYWEHQIFYRN